MYNFPPDSLQELEIIINAANLFEQKENSETFTVNIEDFDIRDETIKALRVQCGVV